MTISISLAVSVNVFGCAIDLPILAKVKNILMALRASSLNIYIYILAHNNCKPNDFKLFYLC